MRHPSAAGAFGSSHLLYHCLVPTIGLWGDHQLDRPLEERHVRARKKNMRLILLAALFALSVGDSFVTAQGAAPDENAATEPPAASADAAAHSLALLRVGEPQHVQVRNHHSGLAAFGAIGGAIQGGEDAEHSKALAAMLNEQHAQLASVLVNDLHTSFASRHVALEYLPDQYSTPSADRKSNDYSNVHIDQHEILNVWFGGMGFETSSFLSGSYVPWAAIHVEVVDPVTKKVLSRQVFEVGHKSIISKATFVPLENPQKFANFDDVIAHRDLAIQALSAAVSTGADAIAGKVLQDQPTLSAGNLVRADLGAP
jgi:hypothetical protein